MKTPPDTKDAAASITTPAIVQTSAQPEAEVQHEQPSTGGSYTRKSATGELVKNGIPAAPIEKE